MKKKKRDESETKRGSSHLFWGSKIGVFRREFWPPSSTPETQNFTQNTKNGERRTKQWISATWFFGFHFSISRHSKLFFWHLLSLLFFSVFPHCDLWTLSNSHSFLKFLPCFYSNILTFLTIFLYAFSMGWQHHIYRCEFRLESLDLKPKINKTCEIMIHNLKFESP